MAPTRTPFLTVPLVFRCSRSVVVVVLLTHLVHDDGLSVQIIIHERKLRVKGVVVFALLFDIRVASSCAGLLLVTFWLRCCWAASPRHERVLLLLLTRISHDSFLSRFESDGLK